jgi:hypothetical protein
LLLSRTWGRETHLTNRHLHGDLRELQISAAAYVAHVA